MGVLFFLAIAIIVYNLLKEVFEKPQGLTHYDWDAYYKDIEKGVSLKTMQYRDLHGYYDIQGEDPKVIKKRLDKINKEQEERRINNGKTSNDEIKEIQERWKKRREENGGYMSAHTYKYVLEREEKDKKEKEELEKLIK